VRYLDEDALKLRAIPMASITAVTDGVKTPLLKMMGKRADRTTSFSRKPAKPLEESCAFSIICRERVVDFYAADRASRDGWLRELQTVLRYAHTYDHRAAAAAVQRLALDPPKACDGSDDTDDE